MKIGEIIYEEQNGIVNKMFNSECIGLKGIWALYGKVSEKSEYVCLNVGQSTDVGREIIYDLGCLHYINFQKDGTKKYINYFGENCGFTYKSDFIDKRPREYLYPYIASQYACIKFIYVHNDNDHEKERSYAKEHHARFWRDGGQRGTRTINVSREDVNILGSYFSDGGERYSLEDLLIKLENDLGYDATRGKRLISECENEGWIIRTNENEYTR